MNLLIFTVVALFLLVALVCMVQIEPFGATSPGTMVQLRTSHVPTEEDWWYSTTIYPKIVRREIMRMTESDPGPILVRT